MIILDIHSHLLPGVDDSRQSKLFYGKMLKTYANTGLGGIVFTPHIDNPYVHTKRDLIQKTFEWATEKAEKYDLQTYLGSEYYVIDQKEIDLIPMFGKYALCETFTDHMTKDYLNVLRRVKDKGYEIIIAHIERYRWLRPDSDVMRALVEELKVKIQVNASGTPTKEGQRYLSMGVVDFLASDCHGDVKLISELDRKLNKYPDVAMKMCDFFAQEIE
ncbi:MAG: hypothetical protein K6G51_05800 [Sphaerochaetaceae bacterium]|nr:hypothetical protein [Sphaerochaetaceae bacterium]